MKLINQAGEFIELHREDNGGWIAVRDGSTYHLNVTKTSTATTPAKARWTDA